MHDTLRRVRAILAASAGNLVEWYDFYVYSFCTLYFAPLFFPHGDRTTQLLQAASVFAIGFLARPVGGWFFGRYADRNGRRAAMVLSVSLMCGGSLLIALLPVYTEAGIVAPALLLLARLVQGFSVGGEYGTSAAYMSEVAVAARRGFFGSFQYVTLIGGQLLAVLVLVLLQQWLSDEQLHAWGWRLPFLLGALFAVVVFWLRRRMPETGSGAMRHEHAGSVRELLRHRRALLVVTGLTAGGSLAFYIYTTYMQKYLVNSAGMDPRTASLLMSVALFVYMLMQPAFGALSDRIGRRNSLIAFAGLSVLGTIPLLSALRTVSDPVVAFGLIMVAYCIISLYTAISGLLKAELFPAHVRALGVGLPYAIANAAFGGTAEAVALWFKRAGIESQFFVYATLMAAVALVAALYMPDTRRSDPIGDVELPPP